MGYLTTAFVSLFALTSVRPAAAQHLRFADVSLKAEVQERLLHAGRAPDPDEVAIRLVEAFPELHLVIIGTHLLPDAPKLRWRDPRVNSEIARFYDVSGWLTGTFERYLPADYAPYGRRPLMNHDVLILNDFTPKDVILAGGLKHAIDHASAARPGRRRFAADQARGFYLIDEMMPEDLESGEVDPGEVLRLTLNGVRDSSLREVDIAEWLLRHRRELALTRRQRKSVHALATKYLLPAVADLGGVRADARREPGIDAAVRAELVAEVDRLSAEVRELLSFLRAAACELDLN